MSRDALCTELEGMMQPLHDGDGTIKQGKVGEKTEGRG